MPNAASQSAHCLFEHRVEYRREVAGRGIDDLQHFGGRGLLFQRLAKRIFAFLTARHVGHGPNQPNSQSGRVANWYGPIL